MSALGIDLSSRTTHTHAQPTHSFPSPNCLPLLYFTSLHYLPSSLSLIHIPFIRSPVSLPSVASSSSPSPSPRLSVPLTSLLTIRSIYLSVIPPLLFPFYSLSCSVDPSSPSSSSSSAPPPPPPPPPHSLSSSSPLPPQVLWVLVSFDSGQKITTPSLLIYLSISLYTCHCLFLVCSRGHSYLPIYLQTSPLLFCHCTHISFEVCAAPVTRWWFCILSKQAGVCLQDSPIVSVGALHYIAAQTEPTVGCIMVNNTVMNERL